MICGKASTDDLMPIYEGVLTTESDVEQKVIMPLLTENQLLSLPPHSIHTKEYLAPAALDKAAGKLSGYYPDYSVFPPRRSGSNRGGQST
jgi:hypothetical protein